jgi:DNA polymerase (family X)
MDSINAILKHLVNQKLADQAEVAGSHRRGKPSTHDMDVVVATNNRTALEAALGAALGVAAARSTKNRTFYPATEQYPGMDVVFSSPGNFGAQMLTWTGSSTFNIACRAKAKSMGMKLNEHGLWLGNQLIDNTEEGILNRLGMGHHLDPATRSM